MWAARLAVRAAIALQCLCLSDPRQASETSAEMGAPSRSAALFCPRIGLPAEHPRGGLASVDEAWDEGGLYSEGIRIPGSSGPGLEVARCSVQADTGAGPRQASHTRENALKKRLGDSTSRLCACSMNGDTWAHTHVGSRSTHHPKECSVRFKGTTTVVIC